MSPDFGMSAMLVKQVGWVSRRRNPPSKENKMADYAVANPPYG